MPSKTLSHHLNRRFNAKTMILLVMALLTLYIFVPQVGSFGKSFATLRSADFALVLLGIMFWLATYFVAAVVYKIITARRLAYLPLLIVQIASGFTNRIAPAGSGAMAVNMRYFTLQGISSINAGIIVALNNLLGFIGNIALGIFVFIFSSAKFNINIKYHISSVVSAGYILLLIAMLSGLFFTFKNRLKMGKIITKANLALKIMFHRPRRLATALIMSMLVTTLYGASLFAVALSCNVHLSILQTLIVLTVGVAVATITPTPGGLGGAEAGLVAVLASFGTSPQQALTVVLTYRFITYWLPIVPGFLCFQLAIRKEYV